MRFLVEIAHRHGVGQQPVERRYAIVADLFGKPEARGNQAAKRLNDRLFAAPGLSPWGAAGRWGGWPPRSVNRSARGLSPWPRAVSSCGVCCVFDPVLT